MTWPNRPTLEEEIRTFLNNIPDEELTGKFFWAFSSVLHDRDLEIRYGDQEISLLKLKIKSI